MSVAIASVSVAGWGGGLLDPCAALVGSGKWDGEMVCVSRGARGEQAPGDEGFWLLRDRDSVSAWGVEGFAENASPRRLEWGPSSQPASEGHAEEGNWASCEVVGIWDPPRVRVHGSPLQYFRGHDVWVQTRSDVDGVCGIQQVQRNEQTRSSVYRLRGILLEHVTLRSPALVRLGF